MLRSLVGSEMCIRDSLGCTVALFERSSPERTSAAVALGLEARTLEVLTGWGIVSSDWIQPLMSSELSVMGSGHVLRAMLGEKEECLGRAALWTDLHAALKAAAQRTPNLVIHWEHRAVEVRCGEPHHDVEVLFENGARATGELLVGADGAAGVVAAAVNTARGVPLPVARYCGYAAWRGQLDVTRDGLPMELVDRFGAATLQDSTGMLMMLANQQPARRTQVFGHVSFVRRSRTAIVWALYQNSETPLCESARATTQLTQGQLAGLHRRAIQELPPHLSALVLATPTEYVFLNDVYDRDPLAAWSPVNTGVTLVGDAAHPTTPHYGKGANMAVQDAFALGACVESALNTHQALAEYEMLRLPETSRCVLQARHRGQLLQGLFRRDLDWERVSIAEYDQLLCATGVSTVEMSTTTNFFEQALSLSKL
eukprot:TRINITY_DN7375_c0_g1_i1.p1 TRINITY_DN7375_c0_g1~~TRINITY_DN7375_c0_g1_i1.p1  ORF type:complete len:427 (+),score=103.40 TRINITY_DN7375_c0_g1_i1:91-1371(+)